MFDLPVDTKMERRHYREFRNFLIKNGFTMLQYSVYIRICPDRSFANKYRDKVKKEAPIGGKVQLLMITEKQYNDILTVRKSKSKYKEIGIEGTIRI